MSMRMSAEPFMRGCNQSFQEFRVFHKVGFAFVAAKRTADTAKSALNMEVALLVIVERMAFNTSLCNELSDICVSPFKYRKIDTTFSLLMQDKSCTLPARCIVSPF